MTKNWQFFSLIITLFVLIGCMIMVNQNRQSEVLATRTKLANPSSIYIKREIKTDLYTPTDSPAPLTGWEMSGTGAGGNEGMMQTKTVTTLPQRPNPKTYADSSQVGQRRQYRDSSAAADRDSITSR